MSMKQGYFVTDDGMCAHQGIATLAEAKRFAEQIINDLPFGEVGRFEVLLREGEITQTKLRFEFPTIDWERI